jgi:cytochrome c biogenesis protein CcmG, thiol:disulfide interchange protein DsbE
MRLLYAFLRRGNITRTGEVGGTKAKMTLPPCGGWGRKVFILVDSAPYSRYHWAMNWIRHNWLLFSILVLTTSLGWIAFTAPAPGATTNGKIPAPREGFLAPDFSLLDAQGQSLRLSDLRGKPVLVNLWASWCGPCQAEMPAMQKVYTEYARRGFTILAVNTTFQDERAGALEFASSRGLSFSLLFDTDGSITRLYQVRAMPTSFFVDREGLIRKAVFGGPMSEALLRAEIEKLLAEGSGDAAGN